MERGGFVTYMFPAQLRRQNEKCRVPVVHARIRDLVLGVRQTESNNRELLLRPRI